MKLRFLLSAFFVAITSFAQTNTVSFQTSLGTFKVMLYDFTPNHRDMFLNEVKNGTYNQALFNRVIKNFVIQGGEHDDDITNEEATIPLKNLQRLAPEFHSKAYHKIGALGAGRDDNEEKASFFNQIYFVVGKQITEQELNNLERKKGIVFTQQQRNEYLTNGGLPRLDNDYTVFGEIIEGLDVVLKLSKVATNDKDYPLNPIYFNVSIDTIKTKTVMIQQLIEHHFKEKLIEQTIDAESVDYFGCDFKTASYSIKYRKAKITPKKVGAFVALWKRDARGNTIPYDQEDPFGFYIIEIEDQLQKGYFLFPKEILIKHTVLSSTKEGKRGFRLYMPWNCVTSVQATKTQVWQLPYFNFYPF